MKKENKSSVMQISDKRKKQLNLQTASGKSGKVINIVNFLLSDEMKDTRLKGVSAKTISKGLGIAESMVRGAFRGTFGVGKPKENNNLKPFGNGVVGGVDYSVGISLQPTIHYHLFINQNEVNQF